MDGAQHRLEQRAGPKLSAITATVLRDGSTGANGNLAFQHNIGNESVIGGSESGTYVSIWNDASEEVGKIEMLDAATSYAKVPTAPLTAPDQDYGGLTWTPLYLSDNRIGYTAAKGDGTYYFYVRTTYSTMTHTQGK